MDATEHAALTLALALALQSAGIQVSEGMFKDGQMQGWQRVPTDRLLAEWITKAWRIELVGPSETPTRVLVLHRDSSELDGPGT